MSTHEDAAEQEAWSATVTAHKQRQLQRIGQVAFDLVAREGISNVSMSALARSVGISRATLYHYVSDVQAAVQAHLLAQAEAFHAAVSAAVAEENGPEAQLSRYIREQVAYVAGHEHRTVAGLSAASSPLQREGSASAHRARQHDVLDDILARGMEQGVFLSAPVPVQAILIGRLLYSAEELLHRQGLSTEETATAITTLVFEGIHR